jgi:hypothetical protein
MGVAGFLVWLFMIPSMARMMREASGNIPNDFIRVMIIFQVIFLSILLVVLPLVFVLFYGSRSVKATVEREDPKVRWTDKCPLPVLALCFCQVLGALQIAASVGMGIGIPVFGTFIQGTPMVIVTVGISLFLLYLAWASYHLKPAGWFGTLAMLILGTLSSVITFRHIDLIDLYARMGYQGKQLEMMKKVPAWTSAQMEGYIIVWALLGLGFLWYLRRYFTPATPKTNFD